MTFFSDMGKRLAPHRGLIILSLLCFGLILPAAGQSARLRVSAGGRYLETTEGKPFFWLGDTAWFLFANLDRDEATKYLWDRKNKQFTVVQASLLGFNIDRPNALGNVPFTGRNVDHPDEAYWKHVDFIVEKAEELGLYMALLPAWAGEHVENKGKKTEGVLNLEADQAYRYGKWLGARYADRTNIIWVLGGDVRPSKHEVYDNLARGLTDAAGGDPGRVLISYHPPGGTNRPPATSTGEFYHDRPWLDFNMIQSGHRVGNKNYERIAEDYARTPVKPTLDAEPCYEQHPIRHQYRFGAFNAWNVRRRAYWSLLAGAFGFTYGGNGIWQMDKPGRIHQYTHHRHYWWEALHYEGAFDMTHLRALMESRPFLDPERVPDQSIILSGEGAVDDRVQAARAADRSYWFVYLTSGDSVRVDLGKIAGRRVNAWWFNPRDGRTYNASGQPSEIPFMALETKEAYLFDPPGLPREDNDWVLVLDDAARNYPAPGRTGNE